MLQLPHRCMDGESHRRSLGVVQRSKGPMPRDASRRTPCVSGAQMGVNAGCLGILSIRGFVSCQLAGHTNMKVLCKRSEIRMHFLHSSISVERHCAVAASA